MTKNMGSPDRMIRIAVAIVLAALIAMGKITGTWAYVAGAVAAIFLVTSLIGFCPAYRLVGVNSCGK